MRLRPEGLEAHLAKSLAPVYLVHGDEPLGMLEAADAVRAAARKRGYQERSVFTAERGFDWSELAHALGTQSLFGDKKVVELRLATGRPGAPAAKAIVDCCERPNPDALLLVTMPRPQGPGWWKAPWFVAVETAGAIVEVQAPERAKLPAWIAARLARQGQRVDRETLETLAQMVEGNLLAAHQEILKLALLAPRGDVGADEVRAAVANVARYDFDTLAAALCAGSVEQYARALHGLRGEGESAATLAWRLGDELASLARVAAQRRDGRALEALYAENRIYKAAQARAGRMLERVDAARLAAAAAHVARIERAAKGVGTGDPWDELVLLGLELA